MTILRKTMVAAGALLVLGAAPTAGQEMGYAMAAPPAPTVERADELKAQAEALYSQPKRWRKAMRLLEQSAALRAADDPEAFTCLMFAGRLGAAVGEYSAARAALQKAGEHALARGAVTDAAYAFIDAAHAAAMEKDVELARELLDRAALLAKSPLLSAAERQALTYRLRV